ncbi:MAG: HAD-IIIA family hydrolase [Planctomycetota bacterium]|jgi:D,D-heptose 1,7-bisphosphate phosphatase
MMGHKAIFFDRDDTLLDDPGYIKHPDQVKLLGGAAEAVKQLRKMGYKIVIITNQSGVARGYVTEEGLSKIHQKLKTLLADEGATIDGIYYCPYHPDGVVKDFSMESNLRKPNAGMLFQAAEEMNIDLKQSWKIGDTYRDIKAGKTAGCRTILVDVPGKIREKQPGDVEPDRKAVNLREAVNIIRMVEFHQKAQAVKDKKSNVEPAKQMMPEKTKEKKQSEEPEIKPQPAASKPAPEPTPVETKSEPVAEPKIEKEQAPMETAVKPEEKPAQTPTAGSQAPRKFHTTKKLNKKPAGQSLDTHEKTHHLLEEILRHLKTASRQHLYEDFSIYKLIAGMVQMLVVLCLVLSIYFWLNPEVVDYGPVQTMASYAIALQLLVIALLMMRSKD